MRDDDCCVQTAEQQSVLSDPSIPPIEEMESNLPANSTLTHFGVLETLGLLFYVASPSGTSYQSIEECPDFVNQVKRRVSQNLLILCLGDPLYRHLDRP